MQMATPADQVSASSAVVFRVSVGALVAFAAARLLAKGWVESLYLSPKHHLPYPGFGWVRPLPSHFMYVEIVVIGLCGLALIFGYRPKLALAIFLVAFTHIELIDAALYLNHYWYLTLLSVLLLVLPGATWGGTVPLWVVWMLRAQVGAVYLFAGIAKLNADWLFRAQPLATWFADRSGTSVVGPLLELEVTAFVAAWLGAMFDCTVIVWLSMQGTRRYAYLALVSFHIITWLLFNIGVFPWVMIATATIFFSPTWPEQFRAPQTANPSQVTATPASRVIALALLVAVQIVLPIRHHFYDSNVQWSEEGYYFAWRVMLTEKAGFVEYNVSDPSSDTSWTVSPELVLTDWQARHASTRPDLIKATAELIATELADQGIDHVEIRADAFVTINGSAHARLIDPSIDLVSESATDPGWILPRP